MTPDTTFRRLARRTASAFAVVCMMTAGTTTAAQAQDLSYLQGLLDAMAEGTWVKASTNLYSDAWASPLDGGLPSGTYSDPGAVVKSWSNIAWDPNRARLMLWGGGHAAYMGNEMYLWEGASGTWTRGSLPSRLVSGGNAVFYVVDDAAPQSAHSYDNGLFLPHIDRYVTFGGAAFNTGAGFVTRDANGNPVGAGPWLWDPSKADANKVGGTTGSGYLPSVEGGQMWANRADTYTGTRGQSPLEGTSAYREENGRDVVYTTRDSNASGFPNLYRYMPGDPATNELDRWDVVGRSWNASSSQSAAAIDSDNGYYVRISNKANTYDEFGLGLWDLNQIDLGSDALIGDRWIELHDSTGAIFRTNRDMGIAFDEASGRFYLWDGKDFGTVYSTAPEFDASGTLLDAWTVTKHTSAGAQPEGNFANGVLGKWIYVAELQAFIALDEYNAATQDAAVWLYKPQITMIPEPQAAAMLIAGLIALQWRRKAQARRG
ncbi:hypothetical protein V4F39_23260 [Aquincola sp. MAHUQ-54]|uniref:PEP-CTERM protein-sorting domain-containing protein n=1 Tax=Aquincola agrisoli TaxID=3119538 RepID=A0AAW9QJ49_9BURK